MITPRRQQQCIANLIGGFEPGLQRQDLDNAYQALWDIVQQCNEANYERHDIQQELIRFGRGQQDKKTAELIDLILTLESGTKPHYQTLTEIGPTLSEIQWLWHQWLPRGMLTLLAAWPGVGKTYFALDLAHRLMAGLAAPDGSQFARTTGRVIYVDAEDFLPAIYARTKAWGMDGSNFYPLRKPPHDLLDMEKPEYQDLLRDMCYDLKPDLVVVDSLSVVNVRGENNIEDIRYILSFFAKIPEEYNCGLILIHHPRKPGKGLTRPITMHDLRGTGHITATARIIIGLDVLRDSPDENPNGPRQVKTLKNNLTRYPKPLAAQFAPLPDNAEYVNLVYDDIDRFILPAASLTEQCAQWLIELLQEEGSLRYEDITMYAADEDFKSGTLWKARRLLGDKIIDTKGPRERGNQWALADETIDPAEVIVLAGNDTLTKRCAAWLRATLQDGPMSYAELKELAVGADFTENILQNARHHLGSQVIDTKGPKVKGNQWALANNIT